MNFNDQILALIVDEILVTGTNLQKIKEVKEFLYKEFTVNLPCEGKFLHKHRNFPS